MIYGIVGEYRRFLLGRYRPQTAETYYKRLCTLLDGQSIRGKSDNLNYELILGKLGLIKHKNHFSQAKNAFFRFCEFMGIELSSDILGYIEEMGASKKKKYRKLKQVDFSSVEKKIRYIRNKKLKLSFQVMIATGLRVSELADITTNDSAIHDDRLSFAFIGKGGSLDMTTIQKREYPKLCKDLSKLIESTPRDRKIFYSAVYLQSKARKLGFTCLDLRRACAKLEYKKSRSKLVVRRKLRHSSIRTTNIYLRSKVKV